MADTSGLPSPTWGCLPPGWIGFFAADAAPNGFLICNGAQNLSRVTYARMFAVIGTRYGAGDGSTTFGIPDLRDKVVWGSASAGNSLDAGLPNIMGTASWYRGGSSVPGMEQLSGALQESAITTHNTTSSLISGTTTGNVNLVFDASKANSIYGKSLTVQPPALTLLPCIKY